MKFKYLIIAFSIIIVIFILITALMPLLMGGSEFAANFRYLTLPLLVFMLLLLIGMGVFFLLNYRLLSLLEREDWPALSYYLEQKVYVKGRYTAKNVRLLASSYLVMSDYPSILRLESKASLANPPSVEKNILIFGAAKVMNGAQKEAVEFFFCNLNKGKPAEREWIRWYYGFSHLLSGSFSKAEPEFMSLAASSGGNATNDALIAGLSSYFLYSSIAKHSLKPDECLAAAENGRSRVAKALKTPDGWKKETDRRSVEIYIAIIRKYIDETGEWLFRE